jgi:hypothetical protein
MGHRGRHHRNYILCPGQGILPFIRVSIPPVLRVLDESYSKRGKWSHTTWTVELAPGYDVLTWSQDWGNGKWFPTQTWEATLQEVRRRIQPKELIDQITDEHDSYLDQGRSSRTRHLGWMPRSLSSQLARIRWLNCSRRKRNWLRFRKKKPL